ncbi:MAG: VCBS repeat-containing protein [Spirochaetota bacterium]
MGKRYLLVLVPGIVALSCLPTAEFNNPLDPGFSGVKISTKNIACASPYGISNPCFIKNKRYSIVAPRTYNGAVYSQWRCFSADASTEWSSSPQLNLTFVSGGMKNISIQMKNASLFAGIPSNTVCIPSGGSGVFTEIGTGSLQTGSVSCDALGDIDGDGDLDLIVSGEYVTTYTKIYRNSGGSFSEIFPGTLTGVRSGSLALGDIDGDGDLDLVLTGNNGVINIGKIYRNNGSGSFSEINAGSLATVRDSSIALGDLDADGDLDLILTGFGATHVAKIYRNNGSGQFSEIYPGSIVAVRYSAIALGDIDNDTDLDVIVTGDTGAGYCSKIYLNNGSGSFSEVNSGTLHSVANGEIKLVDVDGDGDLDLILTGDDNGSSPHVGKIYQNNGEGSFSEIYPGSIIGLIGASIAIGDIDGDGDFDIIVNGMDGIFYTKIYRNNSNGSFSEIYPGSLTAAGGGSVLLGDIDGDGDIDAVHRGYTGVSEIAKIYRNGP